MTTSEWHYMPSAPASVPATWARAPGWVLVHRRSYHQVAHGGHVQSHDHCGAGTQGFGGVLPDPARAQTQGGPTADAAGRNRHRTRGNYLTPAGEAFLPLATALVRSADQAAASTRAAARPNRLTVGYAPGLIITPAVRELRHRHPNAELHTLYLAPDEPRPALLDHRVDVAIARLPFPTVGLDVTALYDEPRVVVVPLDHRLAGKESVTVDDIADEPIPRMRGSDPLLDAFWRIDPRPDGRPAPDGPLTERIEDKLELIAAGQAVIITAHAHAHSLRPDLTAVRLAGVEPSHVVLAARANDRNGLVTAFRAHARTHLTGSLSQPAPASPGSRG
jgi:DNA-binding transcriptional LysR family regulator